MIKIFSLIAATGHWKRYGGPHEASKQLIAHR